MSKIITPRSTTLNVNRRRVLQGIGIGAAAPLLRPFSARAAGKVTELIVLTGVTPWLPAYQKVAAQYEQEKGVKITLRQFPYGGMRTQMINAIQSKNPVFDVYQLDEPWTGQFYDNGWVRPLSDIDPTFSLNSNTLTYDSLPFWNKERRLSSSDGGKIMSVPLNGNVDLLVYRKDLYEKLGLTPPRTWNEAIENGRKAQAAGVAKFGYVTRGQPTTGGQSITYEYMPVFYSSGANWFVDEGRDWTPAVNSDAAKAGTETFRKLLELGPAQPQTVGQADVIALMQGGQAFQGHFVAAAAPQLEDPNRSAMVGKFGYAVVPAGASGHPSPTSGTWSLCVPADQSEERQKAAAEFIAWTIQKPQQANFVRGGGIPSRRDISDAFGAGAPYMQAVINSMPNVRRSIRYIFGAPMLEAIEPILGQIGSGTLPVNEGLDRLQVLLTKVVKDAGFLK